MTTDQDCDGTPELIDRWRAASQPATGNRCFFIDVGLKGGLAQSANEQPILFNDGIGSSQMGALDCDPNIPQGQILIDGVIQGCGPWYAPNRFDTVPLCPQQNNIFTLPNPGAPWADWPPLRCIKTRPTGSMNQLERGFDGRFFGNQNANSCPGGAPAGPATSRVATTGTRTRPTAIPGTPTSRLRRRHAQYELRAGRPADRHDLPDDTEAFTGSGQNTYPITGFIEVYITGYGRIQGNGSLNVDDPCPGKRAIRPISTSRAGTPADYAVWGHILKHARAEPWCDGERRPVQPHRQPHALRARPGRIGSAGGAVWGG